MITVKLEGGLGNQMFQYAAAKSLALRLNSPLFLDANDFADYEDRNFDLHVFPNITEKFIGRARHKTLHSKAVAARIRRKLLGCRIYKELHFHVDPEFFSLTAPVNLTGYFQSEKYFIEHEAEIRNHFTWDSVNLSLNTQSYLRSIESGSAISIHFRRGDYVSSETTNETHGTCSESYYKSAISFMTAKYSGSHFFVFSDDIAWVKGEHLFAGLKHTYVEKTQDMHDSEEMFLMSKCEHNIVANSSFSWWGAWLNNAPRKVVIAPKNWFRTAELDTRDLVPESWQRF